MTASPIKQACNFPQILDIREKVAISRFANTGAYGFPSATAVKKQCAEVIDANMMGAHGGIYYISGLISAMIASGTQFAAIKSPDFASVSSPAKLKLFLRDIKSGKYPSKIKMRICFDLDNAMLVTTMNESTGESKVRANKANLEIATQLKSQGHTIILWTSQTADQNDFSGKRLRVYLLDRVPPLPVLTPPTIPTNHSPQLPTHHLPTYPTPTIIQLS
jgi:hypothetical protein